MGGYHWALGIKGGAMAIICNELSALSEAVNTMGEGGGGREENAMRYWIGLSFSSL